MKKFDFKKLALMGITGGVMIATQSAVQAEEANDQFIAAMGCGGKQGCSGSPGYSAPSSYSYNTQQGCSSSGPVSYSRGSQNSCASSGPVSHNRGAQSGCASAPTPGPQSGCASHGGPTSYRQAPSNSGYETSQIQGPRNFQGGYQQNAPYGNQTSQSYQINQQRPIQQPSSTQGGQQQPQQYTQSNWGNQNYNEPSSMRDPHPSLYRNETAYEDVQSQTHRSNAGGNNQSRGNSQQGQQQGQQQKQNQSKWYTADSGKVARKITEAELVSQLNEQGKAQFNSLDAEGKALALQLANAECKGKNSCKGLGSCANEQHSCAGKNSCSGQSGCKFTDKNKAVKVAAMKMAEKRSKLNAR